MFHSSSSDDELINSFLSFITPRECEIIKQCMNGEMTHKQAIIDILSEYSIFDSPSPQNIETLIIKAAKVALIRLPWFPM